MGTASAGRLIMRADAGDHIGAGHIMRCLALAHAWVSAGGEVVFWGRCENQALLERIGKAGFDFVSLDRLHPDQADLERLSGFLTAEGAEWLVLDGYHFDTAYQEAVLAAGCRLLVIDDNAHLPYYHADILLNQNIHAGTLQYNVIDPDTTWLLGTQYALLRPEFLAYQDWQREIPALGHRVLVTLGGGDSENAALRVLEGFGQLNVRGLEAVVVLGAAGPALSDAVSNLESQGMVIRVEQDARNMPELMAWADVAISGGGSTCWELAFMGLPNIILVLAENQRLVAEGLQDSGISVNLGWYTDAAPSRVAWAMHRMLDSPGSRAERSKRGRDLVDGNGAGRVVQQMMVKSLGLRPVKESDIRLVWEWANDPVARAVSFSARPIPWENHEKWFAIKLRDPNSLYYIVQDAVNTPVGQVRYQIVGEEAVVSVSLAPEQRGKGYGSHILKLSARRVFDETGVKLVHAYIKPGNEASVRAFTKAGYVDHGKAEMMGNPALDYVLSRYRHQRQI